MTMDDRQSDFKNDLLAHLPAGSHMSPCYGTSNIARMVPGGFVLAVSNLANYSTDSGPLCLVSRICPLPNVELYFCAVVGTDQEAVLERLRLMLEQNKAGDPKFGTENNNTSVCVADDRKLYFYNKKISEVESPVQDYFGNSIEIDKFYYSVYLPENEPEGKAFLKMLITKLTEFFGGGKMEELKTWGEYRLVPRAAPDGAFPLQNAIADFVSCAQSSGLHISDALASRLMASLLAKRFLILTGLSGSGKTKIADALSSWICRDSNDQVKLIPVGADWTNTENLLGFADALRPGAYCKPANNALDVILDAAANPTHPYFLILDEMNLSHVERYFSDILSAIESGKKIGLHGGTENFDEIPPDVFIPSNLFIIGTVNIDETTYMFSPKVLDRANVIEFRVTVDQINQFLEAPDNVRIDEIAGQGANYGEAFVELSCLSSTPLSAIPNQVSGATDFGGELKDKLVEVFDDLAGIGSEFGFRTAYEISRFIYFHGALVGSSWNFEEALDAQVLQKLLPKLHGSERRLGPVLMKLREFCLKYSLSMSREKIDRMADRLKDGFTSFAEA